MFYCIIGYCYGKGVGVPKDEAKAVQLYRLAADQGHASAQYSLGWFMLASMIFYRSFTALYWNLGILYRDGLGVPKDEFEAVRWFRLAADQGDASAQVNLGKLEF